MKGRGDLGMGRGRARPVKRRRGGGGREENESQENLEVVGKKFAGCEVGVFALLLTCHGRTWRLWRCLCWICPVARPVLDQG